MIEIVSTPPLNTVQDLGRRGQRHLGVGTAGAMDALALAVGNAMLGQAQDAAAVEVQTFPFTVRFLADADFALTGADARATLDGAAVLPWWCGRARAGQVLTLSHPTRGARTYLTLSGGIDVPEVLGSRSTDLRSGFGGCSGRSLVVGDQLALGAVDLVAQPTEFGVVPPQQSLFRAVADGLLANDVSVRGQTWTVRVLPAGERDRFSADMQRRFCETAWQISHQSNRAGYRLTGPDLLPETHVEMRSYGVVPGLVQVPPGGQPIIQLSDANTAGGYPKMATVIGADLWRVGQARAGDRLRFVDCSYAEALQAQDELRAYVAAVRCRGADGSFTGWVANG